MNDEQYIKGFQNRMIRYYYYLSNGLGILNEFRNLFLGIFALYVILKLENIWYIILMTIPSILILTVIGYYTVHKVSKVREYIGIKFATHYGIKSFNYTQEQNELLKKILKELKGKKK